MGAGLLAKSVMQRIGVRRQRVGMELLKMSSFSLAGRNGGRCVAVAAANWPGGQPHTNSSVVAAELTLVPRFSIGNVRCLPKVPHPSSE